jgi:hypothetical protein
MLHLVCAHLNGTAAVVGPFTRNSGEADWVRRVGVLVGHIGAVIAARNGVVWLVRDIREHVRSGWRRRAPGPPALRPPRPPDSRGPRPGADGHPAAPRARDEVAALVGEFTWHREAPPDEKAEVLRTEVIKVHRRVTELDQAFYARHAELRTLVETKVGEFVDVHRTVRTLLDERDRHQSAVDGRGMLLVAVGILLTGLPGELAYYPALGWVAIALSVLLTSVVAKAVVREGDTG